MGVESARLSIHIDALTSKTRALTGGTISADSFYANAFIFKRLKLKCTSWIREKMNLTPAGQKVFFNKNIKFEAIRKNERCFMTWRLINYCIDNVVIVVLSKSEPCSSNFLNYSISQ